MVIGNYITQYIGDDNDPTGEFPKNTTPTDSAHPKQRRLAHILRHEITEEHRWRYFRNIALGSPQGGQWRQITGLNRHPKAGNHKLWFAFFPQNCAVRFAFLEKNLEKHVWFHPDPESSGSGSFEVLRVSQKIWSDRSRWRTLLVALAMAGWSVGLNIGWPKKCQVVSVYASSELRETHKYQNEALTLWWSREKKSKSGYTHLTFNPSIRFPWVPTNSANHGPARVRNREIIRDPRCHAEFVILCPIIWINMKSACFIGFSHQLMLVGGLDFCSNYWIYWE